VVLHFGTDDLAWILVYFWGGSGWGCKAHFK